MSEELHITSLVVHVQPPALGAVEAALRAIEGAQVHGSHPAGKLVVTLEAGGAGAILQQVRRIQGLPGVLNASLVYQGVVDEQHAA